MHSPGVPPQQFVHPAQHAEQQNFQPRQPVGIANAPPPPPPGKILHIKWCIDRYVIL